MILARPRLCEEALKNKVVQQAELAASGMAAAWQGIQAVLVTTPYIFKARTKLEMLTEALPELLVLTPGESEAPLECFTLGATHVHQAFEVELVELLGVQREKGIEEVFLDTLLKRKTLRLNHHYRCVCVWTVHFASPVLFGVL